MRANESDLGEILDMIDMESWLDREGVRYRVTRGSRGPQLNVKECPVCGSNNWKVYLNAETGLGTCFAGDHPPGENFNKFSFIRAELGGIAPAKVIEHLRGVARELGWQAKRLHGVDVEMEVGELRLPESVPISANGENLPYLEMRGIGKELASYFGLRYSDRGVFWYRSPSGVAFQSYAGRVIIPIFDLEGKLVSFQGRDVTGLSETKYLFPPGYAAAGRYLYNGQNAHRSKTVVIGEGVFDAMAIKKALDEDMGLRTITALASFGKHLSCSGNSDQLGQLMTLRHDGQLEDVVFMWDAEPRAIADAVRAAQEVQKVGLKARIAILPRGLDPNEATSEAVRKAYYEALPATRANLVRILMNNK